LKQGISLRAFFLDKNQIFDLLSVENLIAGGAQYTDAADRP
jgi:hypothetical protein